MDQAGGMLAWAVGAIVVGALGYFASRVMEYGGIRGALFGARVAGTVGHLDAIPGKLVRPTLRLYRLELEQLTEHLIGIEVVTKGLLGYHVVPVRLTKAQTQTFISLLQQAQTE